MKTLSIFLLIASVLSAGPAPGALQEIVDAQNFPLSRVFAYNETYVGVLVDSKEVVVSSSPPGLLGELTLGTVNALIGTRLGYQHVTVQQYVVRLDSVYPSWYEQAKLVTVIQGGGENLVKPGTPVFLITNMNRYGRFTVRMVEATAKDPHKAYQTIGLEEARVQTKK